MIFLLEDRIHTSTKDTLVAQDADWEKYRGGIYKPPGLWYGFGDSWIEWCEAEGYHTQEAEHSHAFKLVVDETRILRISTVEGIDEFTEKYKGRTPYQTFPMPEIDWARVAVTWDGIEINPYLYQRRLSQHTLWYYPWDCASGVIWKARAILSITKLPWVKKEE